MAEKIAYPIGEQDFKSLRLDGCIYADKTAFIAKILEYKNKYFFLARPRRFGKSLFLSTLRYFFEGERDLFKGLHVDSIGYDWQQYPVLYLDLNTGEYTDPVNLDHVIEYMLENWEKKYNIETKSPDISTRFKNVIKGAFEATAKPVVILVDEYDKPLVKNLNRTAFETYREKLAALYSNFKTSAEYIKIVFLTGVSRFSKLTVFSGLNNISDITFDNEFADVCGITEKELFSYFKPGIEKVAEEYDADYEEACSKLKKNYDGYRFAEKGSDIYNPWSLLNCLQRGKILKFRNATGMPTIMAESLKRLNVNLEDYLTVYCPADDLLGFDITDPKPIALMYQTGYLTIKDYNRRLNRYRLGIPNNEVKDGFFKVLLPYYVKVKKGDTGYVTNSIITSFLLGEPQKAMEALQIFFAGIPYPLKMEDENNFQNAFFLLISLIGIEADAEVTTSDGRIDMVIKTDEFIYIIELKYDGSARAALNQINEKRYDLKYRSDSRRIIKIGVNFSSSRTITDWLIEK